MEVEGTRRPEMVEVSTTQYEFAHGRRPRGRGDWAFFFDGSSEPFWVCDVSYSEARQHAVRVARDRQVCRVEVAS
jgi:hypothetical protein